MSRDNGDNNGFGDWGGYMEAKITKLGEQFSAASAPYRASKLFEGISIFVNGFTKPSADELKRIMMTYGGTYHHYELSSTKFIIASNLPDVKLRNMNTSKIITPNWVVDCVAAKRILDYRPYLLHTSHNRKQPKLAFGKSKSEQQISLAPTCDVPTTEQNIVRNLQALASALNVPKKNGDDEELENITIEPAAASACVVSELMESQQASQGPPADKSRALVTASVSNAVSSANITLRTGHNTTSVARTAVDPLFLQEFFKKSRLHHIATLGAELKDYICKLRYRHDSAAGFPERQKLKQLLCEQTVPQLDVGVVACVMHIDMDCFFVSVGMRTRPHLRGKPVAVTHSQGGAGATEVPSHQLANRQREMELYAKRFEEQQHNAELGEKVRGGFVEKSSLSEIASCNYAAREKGIRNGMFVGHALKLCPELVTIPYDFDDYKEVAYTLYNTIAAYTLNIEAKSCDEMYVDLRDVLRELQVAPMHFVKAIRDIVFERTGCPCSAGVGANRLQARLATKSAKPNGQFQLTAANVMTYMANVAVEELPSIGSSIAHTLQKSNIRTCRDLQAYSVPDLQALVGRELGKRLYDYCRGIDNVPLAYEQVRKSVSVEVNYGIRFEHKHEVDTFLRQLCVELHNRLLDIERKAKCITLKLMVRAKDAPRETSKFMGHGFCDTMSKSISLGEYTNGLEVITQNVLNIMQALNIPPAELRGIGIQLTKLDELKPNVLKSMFARMEQNIKKTTTANAQAQNKENLKQPAAAENKPSSGRSQASGKGVPGNSKASIIQMLQTLPESKANKRSSAVLPHDIDPEVFHSLPADIRAEIINGQATDNPAQLPVHAAASAHMPLPPNIDPDVFKNLPMSIRKEIMAAVPRQTITPTIMHNENGAENQSILNESDFQPTTSKAAALKRLCKLSEKADAPQQPKQSSGKEATPESLPKAFTTDTLTDWVLQNGVPLHYDINAFGQYAGDLVIARELTLVYDQLLLLKRLIQRHHGQNCAWHRAFEQILEHVNNTAKLVYAKRELFMAPDFNCSKCGTAQSAA